MNREPIQYGRTEIREVGDGYQVTVQVQWGWSNIGPVHPTLEHAKAWVDRYGADYARSES